MTQSHIQGVIRNYTGPKYARWSRPTEDLAAWEETLVASYLTNKDSAILNVGCGSGRETFAFYKLGYRNVFGADCTPALLEVAKKRNQEKGWPLVFALGSAEQLPFPAERFDAVTMFENIYGHITPRAARLRSLAEVRRVLKPSGLVLFDATSISNSYLCYVVIRVLQCGRRFRNVRGMETGDKLMHDAKQTPGVPKSELPRSHWFSRDEIIREAQESGLDVVQVSTQQGLCKAPKANATRFHGDGRLVCVLRKPS